MIRTKSTKQILRERAITQKAIDLLQMLYFLRVKSASPLSTGEWFDRYVEPWASR